MTMARSSRPARLYIACRAETTNSRRPVRAPYSAAPTAYIATSSATNREAEPTKAKRLGRLPARGVLELRRALRDERVALPHERAVAHRALHDHLASLLEGIRHRARVD